MRREGKKYLYDIHQAAAMVADFTRDKTYADYERDAMLRAAVERKFEVIGEAMNRLAAVDSTAAARISEYRRIVAFRNVLIHQYADVDDRLVWEVVETKLPTLIRKVDAMLEER